MNDIQALSLLKYHPLCRICKKPLTWRSLCTDDEPEGMHIRCYNRTCRICGRRVERKDRWIAAHRPFHKRCFLTAWNKMRQEKYALPPLTWEEFVEIQKAFWGPGGTATQILSQHFPPEDAQNV